MPRIEISHEDAADIARLCYLLEPGVVLTRAEVVHRVLVEWRQAKLAKVAKVAKVAKRHNLPYLSIRGLYSPDCMSLDKRRQVAERIIALLREEGYIRTGGEINRETGECRINLVGEDDSMWINIRDAPHLSR